MLVWTRSIHWVQTNPNSSFDMGISNCSPAKNLSLFVGYLADWQWSEVIISVDFSCQQSWPSHGWIQLLCWSLVARLAGYTRGKPTWEREWTSSKCHVNSPLGESSTTGGSAAEWPAQELGRKRTGWEVDMNVWLVVWNMNFIFPYIGTDYPNWLIFFRGVETTNQAWVEIEGEEYQIREFYLLLHRPESYRGIATISATQRIPRKSS